MHMCITLCLCLPENPVHLILFWCVLLGCPLCAVRYFAEQLSEELSREPSVKTVANLVAQVREAVCMWVSHK
jgi:hypothetical protein